MPKSTAYKHALFIFVFLFFISILGFRAASFINTTTQHPFDDYSQQLMGSNLIHFEQFGVNSHLVKIITHDEVAKYKQEGVAEFKGRDVNMMHDYTTSKGYPESRFVYYCAHILAHRFLHNAIQTINPLPRKWDIFFIKWFHITLSALCFTFIFIWIRRKVGAITACLSMLAIACTPDLITYSSHFYWAGWSLLLPMVSMIIILSSQLFENATQRKKVTLLCAVAFISCAIKCACYFELVTTSMIAMMIPVFYYIIEKKLTLTRAIALILLPSIAAITGLITIFLFKIGLYALDIGSMQNAIDLTINKFNMRVTGTVSSNGQMDINTDSPSYLHVLKRFLEHDLLNIKGITIPIWSVIVACVVTTSLQIYSLLVNKQPITRLPLLISTWISLLAPLSWIILAKPHAYVHLIICSPIWNYPFTILAAAYVISYLLSKIHLEKACGYADL